ncbi:hypothetical protein MBM_08932 [Drepanopeziza brunnea f. sp. 'multigermtubi' MB_m1]|uniref:Uncharacterized protein n=1 Tax=Marssonina brunnea f. sp. multigermtubi (strain MB_m1) TaxID=1072389 RepID=K1WVL7_MARBU|nr:uncharacterized protein MBM_08932 [Drepanopeziza brunnea f. sp. 'multigermtubi' MB_m1]EKD12703.1 hypothetical protein MBM_08932 [Drepanopeziza brunnea f. sp. 'multigermtubi' MB_m1]
MVRSGSVDVSQGRTSSPLACGEVISGKLGLARPRSWLMVKRRVAVVMGRSRPLFDVWMSGRLDVWIDGFGFIDCSIARLVETRGCIPRKRLGSKDEKERKKNAVRVNVKINVKLDIQLKAKRQHDRGPHGGSPTHGHPGGTCTSAQARGAQTAFPAKARAPPACRSGAGPSASDSPSAAGRKIPRLPFARVSQELIHDGRPVAKDGNGGAGSGGSGGGDSGGGRGPARTCLDVLASAKKEEETGPGPGPA